MDKHKKEKGIYTQHYSHQITREQNGMKKDLQKQTQNN